MDPMHGQLSTATVFSENDPRYFLTAVAFHSLFLLLKHLRKVSTEEVS